MSEKSAAKKLSRLVFRAASSVAQAHAAHVHDIIEIGFIRVIAHPLDVETFKCRKCKQNKPLLEFAKAPARKCGHDLWCKECSKARKTKHRQNQTWEQKIIQGCKKRATEKQVPFNMKPEDLYDATGALPEFCPIFTDIRLDYNHGPDRRKWASVDRKVPALGYTSDNVWVVSLAANMAKSDATSPLDRKRIVDIVMGNIKPKIKNIAQLSLF